MKIKHAIIATTLIATGTMASGAVRAEMGPTLPAGPGGINPPPPGPIAPPSNTPTPTPTCADTCGYAVVDNSGVVHGVIVCQEGCFGGTMPHEYMGCPAGCALVLQAPKDTNGNVAGVHGPDVIYNPDNNTFSRTNPNDGQVDWSLESGQPLDNAYVRSPGTTTPPAPPPSNNEPSPDQGPSTTVPEEPTPITEAPSGSIQVLSYRNGSNAYVATAQPSFFSRIFGSAGRLKSAKAKKARIMARPAISVMRITRY